MTARKSHSVPREHIPEDCYTLDELLSYTFGKRTTGSRAAMKNHISQCEICSAIVEEMKQAEPETVQEFFTRPIDSTDRLPFPSSLKATLSSGVLSEGLRKVKDKIEELTQRCQAELKKITDHWLNEYHTTQFKPALVRSDEYLDVNIDLINLTGNDLIEENLEPNIDHKTWSLAGFSPCFADCRVYMLLIPIKYIHNVIPNWDQNRSQELLTKYFKTLPEENSFFDEMISIPGHICLEEDVSVEFELDDTITSVMQDRNDIVTAIVLLP